MEYLSPVVLTASLLILTGCVTAPQHKDNVHSVSVERQLMTGASIIRSAELPLQNVKSISDTSLTAYFRLTRLADSESYCLYTSSSILGIGWALFDSAQDDTNQQLTMVKIKSDVRRDGLKEEDCIELGRNYLEQHAQSGLDIKLMASNRDIHFSIRPEDVQNFLKSVDNVATDNKSSSGE